MRAAPHFYINVNTRTQDRYGEEDGPLTAVEVWLSDRPARVRTDQYGSVLGYVGRLHDSFESDYEKSMYAPGVRANQIVLFLDQLYVDAAHRNQGLGALLLARLEDEARKRGAVLCAAFIEGDDNEKLRAYYMRLGYTVDDSYSPWVMRKKL